jgi:hypothetical protein
VGRVDPILVLQFKRVRMFALADIAILRGLLAPFSRFATTPHILAETSNFIDQAPPQWRRALTQEFRRYIEHQAEVFIPAEALIQREAFHALGLTDTALLALSAETVVVTMDFHLAARIQLAGGNLLNFNHYKS